MGIRLVTLPILALMALSGPEPPSALAQEVGDTGVVDDTLAPEETNRSRDGRGSRASRSSRSSRSRDTEAPAAPAETVEPTTAASEPPAESRPETPVEPGPTTSSPTPPPTEEQRLATQQLVQGNAFNASEMIQAQLQANASGEASPAANGSRSSGGSIGRTQDTAVIFLDPTTVSVSEGDEFSTTLQLSNPANRRFDHIAVTLTYNSAAIEPLGHRSLPALAGAERVDLRHDAAAGEIRIEIDFRRERDDALLRALEIVWRARREVRSTPVVFLGQGDRALFVGLQGGDTILGSAARESRGVISASVRVYPNLSSFLPEDSETVRLPWVDTGTPDEPPAGGAVLALRPRSADPTAGTLDVDVVLANAGGATADDVRFAIAFDPEALQVLDHHEDNWIEQGVNIWDGPYHGRYPFDLHIANEADNLRGKITYHMGFTRETLLAPGVLATIRFRVVRVRPDLAVDFDPSGTAIRLLGTDVLGEPDDIEDGMAGVVLFSGSRASQARPSAVERPVL